MPDIARENWLVQSVPHLAHERLNAKPWLAGWLAAAN